LDFLARAKFTFFPGSVGRTDFPVADARALVDSIEKKLFTLPDETVGLPGHGDITTIGHEKGTNPYVGCGNLTQLG
jgi:hydroxyacylglutathione hydrolase